LTAPQGPIRLFIAVPISLAAKFALADVERRLAVLAPSGVRWVDPASIHLTLKFLGDVHPSLTPDIVQAMTRSAKAAAPFPVHLSGLGAFSSGKRPLVLLAGVDGDLERLLELRNRLEGQAAGQGVSREGRPFSPHLTLGRVRDSASGEELKQISAAVSSVSLEPDEPWLVEDVHLVQSHLAPGGATYSTLSTAPLGGALVQPV